MTDNEQKQAARKFATFWKDKGYEKGQSQLFRISLLRDVFGVEHPEEFITFEEIKAIPVQKTRQRKLEEFQKKLGKLTFLDIILQSLIQSRGIIEKGAFAV